MPGHSMNSWAAAQQKKLVTAFEASPGETTVVSQLPVWSIATGTPCIPNVYVLEGAVKKRVSAMTQKQSNEMPPFPPKGKLLELALMRMPADMTTPVDFFVGGLLLENLEVDFYAWLFFQ
jgi:hypothetical protein